MKIQLVSDIHTDFNPDDLVVDEGCTVLVVAGDWANGDTLKHCGFGRVGNPRKVPILAVAGNHDWYTLDLQQDGGFLEAAATEAGVQWLDRNRVEIDGWTVLGCTLWTNFQLDGSENVGAYGFGAQRRINDFHFIHNGRRPMTAQAMVDLYERDYAWLDAALSESDSAKTVVITHFGPHEESQHPAYREDPEAAALSAYYTSRTGLIEKHQPALWLHGHTHARRDYSVGRTRVLCNPRGYFGEHVLGGFDPRMLIDMSSGTPEVSEPDILFTSREEDEALQGLWWKFPRVSRYVGFERCGSRTRYSVPRHAIHGWAMRKSLEHDLETFMLARSVASTTSYWPMDVEQFLARYVSAEGHWKTT